jgi:predicted transcriptional regulator
MKAKVSEVIYREDLYPRVKTDPTLVQKYAENIDVLPPIEINQNNILIDGYHRLTAYKKLNIEEIEVTVTETKSEEEVYRLSIERNAKFGMQMNRDDKKACARRLYRFGDGLAEGEIAKLLSVTPKTVSEYVKDIKTQVEEEKNQKIFDMWMASYTQDEIAEAVNMKLMTVNDRIKVLTEMEKFPKPYKLSALYQDDFEIPIYNIWTFNKKTNDVSHPGNSEQTILDRLLYLYTNPFDIVVDPFAGGGATIDVCKKRLRRYWISDRKPIIEREKEIRNLDITNEDIPLNKRWSEVTLTYLDPPYWKQVEGKYSNDPTDLANMTLEDFTNTLVNFVNKIGEKQTHGVIAMLMQPTQWNASERQYTDHVIDIIKGVNLPVKYRVSVPYSTQQYTPQMVNWAKENKELLVLTRELIIWRVDDKNKA